MAEKRCPTCGKTLQITCFGLDRSAKNGRKYQCKACFKAKYAANPEIGRAATASYRERNPESARASVAAYRASNPTAHIESSKAWREANKENIQEHMRAWRLANRDDQAKKQAEWRTANADHVKSRNLAGIANLCDSYVAAKLDMKVSECPEELLATKRLHIQIKRFIKDKK